MSGPVDRENLVHVGRTAEATAADYLASLGYTIVTRRYKSRRGELDLVALDGDTLVFVEVKHRRAEGFVPEESMGRQKIDALVGAMHAYVEEMEVQERETRLDLVAVDEDGLRHYRDILAP
jgi:putative endonuclease